MHRRAEEGLPRATAPASTDAQADHRAALRDSDPLSDEERAFLTLLFNKYRGPLYRYLSGLVRSTEDVAE
ncbi:MAG: hypothetical protein ACRDFS_00595, partial [Chloroflexota bacterium]